MTRYSNEAKFYALINEKFSKGTPHRYAPGSRSGEQQILLEPNENSLVFMLGPTPKMIRAIRPRVDDPAPVRKRGPVDLVGFRLEIAQVWNKDDPNEASTSNTYFLYKQAELDAGRPPLLRKLSSLLANHHYSRITMPTEIEGRTVNEHISLDLGYLNSSRDERLMDADECAALFEFIGSCAVLDDH